MPTIDLTDAEFQAFAGLLDAAVRGAGIRALKDGAAILLKMEAAEAAQKAAQEILAKPPAIVKEPSSV